MKNFKKAAVFKRHCLWRFNVMAVHILIHMTITSILQLIKNEHVVRDLTPARQAELPIFISRLDVIYLGIISTIIIFRKCSDGEK